MFTLAVRARQELPGRSHPTFHTTTSQLCTWWSRRFAYLSNSKVSCSDDIACDCVCDGGQSSSMEIMNKENHKITSRQTHVNKVHYKRSIQGSISPFLTTSKYSGLYHCQKKEKAWLSHWIYIACSEHLLKKSDNVYFPNFQGCLALWLTLLWSTPSMKLIYQYTAT